MRGAKCSVWIRDDPRGIFLINLATLCDGRRKACVHERDAKEFKTLLKCASTSPALVEGGDHSWVEWFGYLRYVCDFQHVNYLNGKTGKKKKSEFFLFFPLLLSLKQSKTDSSFTVIKKSRNFMYLQLQPANAWYFKSSSN